MHARAEIKKKIVDHLKESLPSEVKVQASRRLPLSMQEFPCVLVYADQETCEVYNEAPPIYKRTLELGVEVIVSHSDELSCNLDGFCNLIEEVLLLNDEIGIQFNRVRLKATGIESSIQGEMLIESAKLTFEVVYFDEHNQLTESLPILDTQIEVQVKVA